MEFIGIDILVLTLEGNQCRKYRINRQKISEHFASSKYVEYNKPFMKDLNRLFQMISQSKPLLSQEECVEGKKILGSIKL